MEANAWLERRWDEYLADLSALIEIPSVSCETGDPAAPFGEACAQVLEKSLEIGARMGFVPHRHEGYCATLLWPGQTDEEIGIFAHMDVVPEGTGWQYPPYRATVLGDKIVGRGACDDKGPALSALYALLYLKEQGYVPRHSIRFFFGANEEAGMKDIDYYVAHARMPAFSFTPDAAFPVCHGEKGVLNLTLTFDVRGGVLESLTSGAAKNAVPGLAVCTVRGDGAQIAQALAGEEAIEVCPAQDGCTITAHGIASHAAFPEGSRSAQVLLAQALLKLDALDGKTRRFMEASVALFGDYYGAGVGVPLEDAPSGKLTHVGGTAVLKDGMIVQTIDIRYPVTADHDAMMERLLATLAGRSFTVTDIRDSRPCYIPKDTPLIGRLTEICNEVLGTDAQPYTMGGGTYARHLENAVGYGPGIPGEHHDDLGPGHGGGHQPDEYVTIDKLKKAFAVYARAIPEMDGMTE